MELSSFHTPFYVLEQIHLIYNKTEKRKQIIKKTITNKEKLQKKTKSKAKNKKNIIKKNRKGYKMKKLKNDMKLN